MEPATSGDDQFDGYRVKGPWSPQEDHLLSSLIKRHGPRNWKLIGNDIPGRSGKSCRLRWHNHLSPNVERRPFTTQEDEFIIHAQASYGNSWAKIARMLHARSDNAVKNHWNSTLKRRMLTYNLKYAAKRQRVLLNLCHKRPDCDVHSAEHVASSNGVSTELSLSTPGTNVMCKQSNDFKGKGLKQENTAEISKDLMMKLQEMVRGEVRNALVYSNMGT